MNSIIKYIFLFILFIFLQIAIFNQIYIAQAMSVMIYILFLLWLPFKIPKWVLLLIGFTLGITIDTFLNTGGIHAATCVLIAYLRPFFINLLTNKFEIEYAESPSIGTMGLRAYIYYILFLLFIHNFSVYFLELFHMKQFLFNFLIVIANTLFTIIICIILELLFRKS